MKNLIYLILGFFFCFNLAAQEVETPKTSEQTKEVSLPEQLAQQQLDAYNAGDIDAFLEPYAEDVKIYNFPNKLNMEGKAQMRPIYSKMFKNIPDLHCQLVNRIVMGNTVIDHERIAGFRENELVDAVAVYKIKDGKIAEVYFMK